MPKETILRKTNQLSIKCLVFSFAAASLFVVLVLVIDSLTSGPDSLQLGQQIPPLTLADQDGRSHNLVDYRGRAFALAFLPDLGADSVEELRSLNRSMRAFDTAGLKVFGVASSETSAAKRVHQEEALKFPILIDPNKWVARQFGLTDGKKAGIRASFVIDRDGRLRLPVYAINPVTHGSQLAELSACCTMVWTPLGQSNLVGKPIADFSLPRVSDGGLESLYGNRTQKATVLFVISAECPCSATYDERNCDFAKRYAPKGIRFLAMDSNYGESRAQILEHSKKAGYPYPVLQDIGNVIADRLKAQVTPEVFVMDSKGVLAYHGRIDDGRDLDILTSHDLRNALDFLIAGEKPPRQEGQAFGCAIYRVPRTDPDASR